MRRNMKIKQPIIPLLILIMFVVNTNLLLGCSEMCGNEILQIAFSPDEKRKAVIFLRDCGATTGYSTQISLLDAQEELPPKKGNSFIADSNHGQAQTGMRDELDIYLQWAHNKELIVKYDKRARVFRSKQSADGVTIKYEQQGE